MPYLETTPVSCGVDFFSEFGGDYEARSPQDIFMELCRELKQGMRDEKLNRLQCKFIVFSDVAGGPGDRFGQWLKEKFPDRQDKLTELRGRNPNSRNPIVLYTWELPSIKVMRATEEWKAAKTEDRYNRDGWWWGQ